MTEFKTIRGHAFSSMGCRTDGQRRIFLGSRLDHIMDTFSIVRRKDEDKFDEYRTKRIIVEIYAARSAAARTRKPCQMSLTLRAGPREGALPEWYTGAPRPTTWPFRLICRENALTNGSDIKRICRPSA